MSTSTGSHYVRFSTQVKRPRFTKGDRCSVQTSESDSVVRPQSMVPHTGHDPR